jgi:RNA polymerase sigma factor (sigma-70 family)
MQMSDSELLRLAVGNEAAFEAIYRRHAPRIYRWLARETSHDEALDLVAETFAQMLISVQRFSGDGDAAASAWLSGIARNLLREHLRGRAVLARALRKLEVEQAVAAALARAAAESAKDLDALAFAVDEAVGELSLREQEAVLLRVVDERPYTEVARLLAIDPQAARMRVSRALRTLNIRLRDAR